jgi:hypothetical protein
MPINELAYNMTVKINTLIITMLCLIIFQAPCIAADECGDVIRFYDEEMLLNDIRSKAGKTGDAQKPIIQNIDKEGEPIAMEVPRSIKYNTAIMREGAELFQEGRYHRAARVLQDVLEKYREAGFEEGEIAVLGNLYLIYSKLGDEEEASKYLEAHRKKRRKKADSLMLITPDEANMQEAPSRSAPVLESPPGSINRGTEQTMLAVPESAPTGPEISLISPESENINPSPLKILVKFLPREGTKVDISTLRVELLKLITINITDRLKGYASNEGINVEKAELPSGNFKIRVTLGDTTGGTTSRIFVLKIQ